jgi:uncharacterized protein YegL
MSLRRLPVYLVIDCSESMAGPAFDAVREGIDAMLGELRGDPSALESVWLSVITFSARAKVLVPLTDLVDFQPPPLVLGSGTSLGVALALLEQRLAAEVTLQTAETKGDWKPIVFILTDGDPTDTWFKIADRFLANISGRKANVIAVACGPAVNFDNLRRVTPTVLRFKDGGAPSFREFFKWISQSVRTASARFSAKEEQVATLPPLPPALELAAEGLQLADHRYNFLLSRCHDRKSLYIMRYERIPRAAIEEFRARRGVALPLDRDLYGGVQAYPVDAFDFAGSSPGMPLSVSSDSLLMAPPCPYCGNKHWAKCGRCEQLFCISGGGTKECPWCSYAGNYSLSDEAFEVGRGMG